MRTPRDSSGLEVVAPGAASSSTFEVSMDKPNAPERIYGWLNTQLSIARHYGGCKYNGHDYCIAPNEAGQPLVRVDVLKRERKQAKK